MSRVVFRADGGPSIGSGHVMRCLALASVFSDRGWKVGFAATVETNSSVVALRRSGYEIAEMPVPPADEPGMLSGRWPEGADVLIVDHYGRDAEFERACRAWAKRIFVIDDLADRSHDADLLVDAGAESEDSYRTLVPDSCEIRVGPKFAIVHPAFGAARDVALKRRGAHPVERVFVSFGQVDPPNATADALAALEAVGFRNNVDVALGSSAPHLAAVEEWADQRVRLHVDTGDIVALMSEADLALGAGGGTAWERSCLGLPSIVASIADNQRNIVARLANAGACVDVGSADEKLGERFTEALATMLQDDRRRARMSVSASEVVDGRGAERIVEALV